MPVTETGKKYLAIVVLLLFIAYLCAVSTDEFLIGAYSQYQIRYAGANYASDFDSLGTYLKRAGYNAGVYGLYTGDDQKLPVIMERFNRRGVKTMLYDNTWITGSNRVGVASLGFGNSLLIEAEYQLKGLDTGIFEPDLLETQNQTINPDSYDYVCKHDRGSPVQESGEQSFSNGWAWICDEERGEDAGTALSMPRKRWKPTTQAWPSMLSRDIVFLSSAISDNKLSITFAIRFEDIPSGKPVAEVSLKLYVPPNPDMYSEYCMPSQEDYVTIDLNPSLDYYQSQILAQDYPLTMLDEYGNLLFQYSVDLNELRDYMKGTYPAATREFYHINPELHWYGTGKLTIDYILIEDEFARTARQDYGTPFLDYLEGQISRVEVLDTHQNIIYHMGMDEPRPGQLQMFRYMQEYLNAADPKRKMITAVNLNGRDLIKQDNQPYNHPLRFLSEVRPDRIMVDFFPLQWGHIIWNNDLSSKYFVQAKIDSLFHYFAHRLVHKIHHSNNPDLDIYFVPQTFGIIREDSGNWSYHMPPRSMVKTLKLLPLCYAADGTVDFCLTSNPQDILEGGSWVSPLIHDRNYGQYDNLRPNPKLSAYSQIAMANAKISVYGPLLRGLDWLNANKLMPWGIEATSALNFEDNLMLDTVMMDELFVDSRPDSTGYSGYIQCGYYKDKIGIPSFMMVNRRAVYSRENNPEEALDEVDLHFAEALPQTVCFSPSSSSHNLLGTHIGLFDPFDNDLILDEGGTIRTDLEPGDGRLLELCSSMPKNVSQDLLLKQKVRLSGIYSVAQGANIEISTGSETYLAPHTTLVLRDGASLVVRGDLCIGDSVSIIVEDGASISFDHAKTTWGKSSVLEIRRANLSVDGGHWDSASDANTWRGIRASFASTVTLANLSFSGADSIVVQNSNLGIYDCIFQIGSASSALFLQNKLPGYTTQIINSVSDRGFYGRSNLSSAGITLGLMRNPVTITQVDFQNLDTAILKLAPPLAIDTIVNCRFTDCATGIWLVGNEDYTEIRHCSFENLSTHITGIGIELIASNPLVSDCGFRNLDCAIHTELSLASHPIRQSGIIQSSFYDCRVAIQSRGAGPRIRNCEFKRNDYGVVSHAGANLDMSGGANNVLQNKLANLLFLDTFPYESMIQLYAGHNDFYHASELESSGALDFQFGTGFYDSPVLPDKGIDASYNWFDNNRCTVCDYAYYPYIKIDTMDLSTELISSPPAQNRLYQALSYESQSQYYEADQLYKAIINDRLRRERAYLYPALDGIFRSSRALELSQINLIEYYKSLLSDHEHEDKFISTITTDYLQRAYLQAGEYQAAIDLIEYRLFHPATRIDSLRAALDIQIVLFLHSIQPKDKPISTSLTQYQYSDYKQFRAARKAIWQTYQQALLQDDPEPGLLLEGSPSILSIYPNPFEEQIHLIYSIPQDLRVKIDVYNLRGQQVKVLQDEDVPRGIHRLYWDGMDDSGRAVSSGLYFFKLESGGKVSFHKAILLK